MNFIALFAFLMYLKTTQKRLEHSVSAAGGFILCVPCLSGKLIMLEYAQIAFDLLPAKVCGHSLLEYAALRYLLRITLYHIEYGIAQ